MANAGETRFEMRNRPKLALPIAGVICVLSLVHGSRPALAEEGGSGHYTPGSMASFIDGVAPKPTFLVRYNLLHYSGSAEADLNVPIGGATTAGLDATIWGHALSFFWRPPIEMGERWSYAMSATIPVLSADVSAGAAVSLPVIGTKTVELDDSLTAIGDIVLQPLMLNYNINPDMNVNFRVSLYAPTGSYEVGRLANTGKNYWTFEPTLAFMYFGAKNGRELSLFTGVDFNTENDDTDYTSGTQFHVETTIAQHLPLLGGLTGFGISAYYYQQISDDTGDGATLGDVRANTDGGGPELSYVRKMGGNDLLVELKWLNEYHTKNRLEGDTIFLKVAVKF
mgnify:CR=1 FL=1